MCYSCGNKRLKESKSIAQAHIKSFSVKLENYHSSIPVLSIHNPTKWDYTPIGIVTARANAGTGAVMEFTSSFSDFFGLQSNSTNTKIAKSEELCLALLKKRTLDLNGNAILGVDVDYLEVGSGKGILMVCMTGTAVKINSDSNIGTVNLENINQAIAINTDLNRIKESYDNMMLLD